MAQKLIDIDGLNAVSKVLLNLINTFPGLDGRSVLFSTLLETSGIGFFPVSGAAVLSHTEDVIGHVRQVCLYPFNIVYRAALKTEEQKVRVKEFLDGLGKWLELQTVSTDNGSFKLSEYPALASENLSIESIIRTTPAYLNAAYNDGIEDWVISLNLRYINEFDK